MLFLNRLNIRFNSDITLGSRLSIRFDASFSNITRDIRDDGAPAGYDEGTPTSPAFLAYVKSPFMSPYSYGRGQFSSSQYDVVDESYLDEIHYVCIIMTDYYIDAHYDDIVKYASVVEARGADEGLSADWLKEINRKYYEDCRKYGNYMIMIDDSYEPEIIIACIESQI